jgi:hypothetical protein
LLLDALDEDPSAYGKVKDRLREILLETRPFYRVIITCRTQFFPLPNKEIDVHSHPERAGKITIHGFTCLAKYLSFFDDDQVNQFLSKRFPEKRWFFQSKARLSKKEKVAEIIKKMASLRCRPMLLAYIEVLSDDSEFQQKNFHNEYEVYKVLIDKWLERDHSKQNPTLPEQLWVACMILATEMQRNNKRAISKEELEELKKTNDKVKPIETINLTGRSLLNRNSDGEYRFSHYSIQEFLVVEQICSNPAFVPGEKMRHTDFILRMLLNTMEFRQYLNRFDLTEANLAGSNLSGLDLSNCYFARANLRKSNLCKTKLVNADLSGADLDQADLSGADFHQANLTGIDLKILAEASRKGAILTGAKIDLDWVAIIRQIERSDNFGEYAPFIESLIANEPPAIPSYGIHTRKRKIYNFIARRLYQDAGKNLIFNNEDGFQRLMASVAYEVLTNPQPVSAAKFAEYCQTAPGAVDISAAAGLASDDSNRDPEPAKEFWKVLTVGEDEIRFSYHSLAAYYAAVWIELNYLAQGKTDFTIPGGAADFICFEKDNLRFIPGGKLMITNDRQPTEAAIASFFIGICPVTNLEYERFDPEHKKQRDQYSSADDEPVIYVSWDDADAYCRWLSEKTGRQYRLPDEAEWEYACRAGSAGPYSVDIDGIEVNETNLKDYAVYHTKKTMPVKQHKPNFFGLYDMHGNVWEWCRDYYDNEKKYRVLRGGSWDNQAEGLRSSYRGCSSPDDRDGNIGFRIVSVARTQ